MNILVEAWHYRSVPASLTSLSSDRLALWMHEFAEAAPLKNSLAKRLVQGYVSTQNNHDVSIPVPGFPAFLTVSEFAREGLWASAFLVFRCSVLLHVRADQEQRGTLEDAKQPKAKDELQKQVRRSPLFCSRPT